MPDHDLEREPQPAANDSKPRGPGVSRERGERTASPQPAGMNSPDQAG